jgi:MarR family transcriptional repressor of mepA
MVDRKKIQQEMKELIAIYLAEVLKPMIQMMDKLLLHEGIPLQFDQVQPFMGLFQFGEMSQQEVADLIERDKSSVQRTVQYLEKMGLVSIHLDPKDKRKNILRITDKGQKLAEKIHENAMVMNKKVTKDIAQHEIDQMRTTLTKMKENIGGTLGLDDEYVFFKNKK